MVQDYIQPSIEILNIRIDEPVTTLTDLLFAAACFFASYKIWKYKASGRIEKLFTFYFLTLGMGAAFGGVICHAFLYGLSDPWKLVSWIFLLISVACIVQALALLLKPLVRSRISFVVTGLNILFLFTAMFFTVRFVDFSAVKFYYILGMALICGPISIYVYQRTRNRGGLLMMCGIGLALPTAFIFSYKLGISPWFNHNDISHIILTLSVLIIYRGAVLILGTFPGPESNKK